jgi:hypothetical protein
MCNKLGAARRVGDIIADSGAIDIFCLNMSDRKIVGRIYKAHSRNKCLSFEEVLDMALKFAQEDILEYPGPQPMQPAHWPQQVHQARGFQQVQGGSSKYNNRGSLGSCNKHKCFPGRCLPNPPHATTAVSKGICQGNVRRQVRKGRAPSQCIVRTWQSRVIPQWSDRRDICQTKCMI